MRATRTGAHPVVLALAVLTIAVALLGLTIVWWLTAYVWGRAVATATFAVVLLSAWTAVHLFRRSRTD